MLRAKIKIHRVIFLILTIFFVAIILFLIDLKHKIDRLALKTETTLERRFVPAARFWSFWQKEELSNEDNMQTAQVIRVDRELIEDRLKESVFYYQDNVIARHRIENDREIERSGSIPDGQVKFIDKKDRLRGVATYKYNRRHGPAKTYYEGGQIKCEAVYELGDLWSIKEYDPHGFLRYEANFEDARLVKGEIETGRGKRYYDDGSLKFEWDITKKTPQPYKKFYDRQGNLKSWIVYDEKGRRIKKDIGS